MKYESSHLEKRLNTSEKSSTDGDRNWIEVMPTREEDIEYDEDSPPLNSDFFKNGVFRINGRVIPPRASPSDPHDPELVALMKSLTPLVQMEPNILGGMPVFKNTLVPIKRMFDYLLAGKSMDDFLSNYPTVSQQTAVAVLESDATLFYEEISNAIDSAAIPSSRPR